MAKATVSSVFSHWNTLIQGLQASPKDFYTSVEESINKMGIPDVKLSRVDWKEGGMLSAKREYLQVRRKEYLFDICGAPFGNGFFVSWWLGEVQSGFLYFLANIPIIGIIFRLFIRPMTYYKMDTANMFQSAIQSAVMEAVDGLTKAKGIRALSELERKPILRDFYNR
ncbi:MAG: hypothetical protein ACQ9MH_11710 [Nitrospinales bacterium]